MKKHLVGLLIVLVVVTFASCTFKGTATFHLKNSTSHSITAVNFLAVIGGETDNNSVTMPPDDGKYFYRIEPGTYDIQVAVDGVGTFIAYDDLVMQEGTVYFRTLDDGDLP